MILGLIRFGGHLLRGGYGVLMTDEVARKTKRPRLKVLPAGQPLLRFDSTPRNYAAAV